MRRMTVRDVRLHWPEAEKALACGEEIVVTRDGRPVARLQPFVSASAPPRARFDPRAHADWLSRFWKGRAPGPTSDEWLADDRAE